MSDPEELRRAELAFKAFSHMGLEGKRHALKRWIADQDSDEIKQLALLMAVLILKEKMRLNRLRAISQRC